MRVWNFGRGKGTTNAVKYSLTCEWCGVLFKSKRPDARTCKPSHRSQWSRWVRRYFKVNKLFPEKGPRGNELEQNDYKKRTGWSK